MARRNRKALADPQEEMRGVANSAKTLLANIRFLSVDDPVRTIVITSAVPGEGKTFVSANLASAIATSGETVLLVECDMRRRSMATQLGIHARHGIYSVVSGEVGLLEAVIAANIPNLYFLDAEPHIPNPSDLLNSNRFAEMLQYVSIAFDYVIFDTPPVGTFIDAAVLGAQTDAVFMVVRENFTRRADLKVATEQLSKSGCDLAGVVMNFCESRDSGYYYDYYYSYHRQGDDRNAPKISVTPSRPVLDASSPVMSNGAGVQPGMPISSAVGTVQTSAQPAQMPQQSAVQGYQTMPSQAVPQQRVSRDQPYQGAQHFAQQQPQAPVAQPAQPMPQQVYQYGPTYDVPLDEPSFTSAASYASRQPQELRYEPAQVRSQEVHYEPVEQNPYQLVQQPYAPSQPEPYDTSPQPTYEPPQELHYELVEDVKPEPASERRTGQPDAYGRYPDAYGRYPDAYGRYPDAYGRYPDAYGRYPDPPDAPDPYSYDGSSGKGA